MTEIMLSIIIPVRNEEGNIKNCLDSLINQSINKFEIIVVDDQSTDRSREIIEGYSEKYSYIKKIEIDRKPENWVGKNYALCKGFSISSGDLLLFVDADVVLEKHCLKKTLEMFEAEQLDIMGYAAFQECKSLSEYLVQPLVFYLLNILYPFEKINDKKTKIAALNGIFILTKKVFYEKLGTHEAVKNEVLEDVELAKLAKKQDGKMKFILAPELIKVRMYKNMVEIIEGWSKNFYLLVNRKLSICLMIILLFFVLFYLPIILIVVDFMNSYIYLSWLILVIFYFCCSYYKMGYKIWVGILTPAGSLILAGIIINSIINYRIKKQVKWKNRIYKVK